MKIRLLGPSLIELTRHPKGAVVDCDDSRAKYLIEQGQAEGPPDGWEDGDDDDDASPAASLAPAETGE